MNKKIYKGYELVKAIEDEEIKEGTILIFTSTISKDNKKEVEVVRRPEGLNLYKKDAAEILPTSWLFNSKIEVLEDNTEEIEKLYIDMDKMLSRDNEEAKYSTYTCFILMIDKINELVKAVNQITINLANTLK